MWTPAQRAAYSKALAVAQKHEAALRKLAEMAKHSPAIADQLRDVQARADYIKAVSETALAAEVEGE